MAGSTRAPEPPDRVGPPLPRALVLGTGVTPDDVPELCRQARGTAGAAGGRTVRCDVGAIARPDLVTIDALARLTLSLARQGIEVRFVAATPELRDLLRLAGLDPVVRCEGESALEPKRQPEQRKPARGVEEEGDPTDPVAVELDHLE